MLFWALASLIISLVSSALIVALFGDSMSQLIAASNTPATDPAEVAALFGQMAGMYAVLLPFVLLIFSIFTGAVYRAVLRPTESGMAYLRLGATELRLAVVLVALWALSIVLTFALALCIGVIAAVIAMAAGGGGAGAGIATALIVLVLYLVMIAGLLAFWVKFSFAAPMTFAEGRIRIFQSWKATKGHFWPLLGAYVLAGILGIMVSFLGSAISFAFMMALSGASAGSLDAMFQMLQADYTSLQSFFTAPMIANLVVTSFFSALTYAIFLAPPAVAYRDIVGDKGAARS
ncbi:hypothetical protein GCM10009422_19360 [Brevundimonas kwangchunensis]|uniref:Glycerophosphoryl diester phosphodiesterase membrane domain-containing protein n=2 Tax=Brevundimonas kwangchunensis TaxID=322163 RepID=A0ABN1GY79_9CAUL